MKPEPSLRELVRLAVEHEESRAVIQMTTEEIVDKICLTLIEKRSMLDEYFSFSISPQGTIESLPLLLPGYVPNLNKLPLCMYYTSRITEYLLTKSDLVLVRLGVQVDWEDEKNCFDTFLRELAFFHIPGPDPCVSESSEGEEVINLEKDALEKRQIQHVIFPAAKMYLSPSEKLLKRDFVQLTRLEDLYKV